MRQLIIAEKPSVARDLARVLQVRQRGDGCWQSPSIWISWCVGHVAELCEPQTYNPAWKAWSAASLPMLPDTFQLQPAASSREQFAVLKRLLRSKEVTEVINACDAGREGELIFRFAAELAGCRKPVQRLWLSSLTDDAIRRGMANLRPAAEYNALADAARCRSEADWLVGLNATRALTVHHRRGGGGTLYTVGRVQTPTLAMMVQREHEIDTFVPETYWQVVAQFEAGAGPYTGIYTRGKQDRLSTQAEAEAIRQAVEHQTGTVARVDHKNQTEPPPLLYDLTSLQRLANQRYNLSAADTLATAQALYEKHKLLTYPRTDANHLTEDLRPTLPDLLRSLNHGHYAPFVAPLLAAPALQVGPRIVCDREVGDHHAIIPTGRSAQTAQLSARERQVFDLVARRFIAVFCLPALFALTHAETQVGEHRFLSRGRTCKQAGWQAVDPPYRPPVKPAAAPSQGGAARPAPQNAHDVLLPDLQRGEAAAVRAVQSREGKTKPPPRYNEASLLGAMERAGSQLKEAELRRAMKDSGLGTPATRASIIEALHRRQFIRREGKQLVPTDAGRALIQALPVLSLKSPELTGQWEARLGEVAQGRLARSRFMEEVRLYVGVCVRDIFAAPHGAAPAAAPAHANAAAIVRPPRLTPAADLGPPPADTCPGCKQGRLVRGRRAWGCSRWRQGCNYTFQPAPP